MMEKRSETLENDQSLAGYDIERVQMHGTGGYGSEFESDAEERKKRKREQIYFESSNTKRNKPDNKLAHKSIASDEYIKQEARNQRFHFLSQDAYSRHKQLINNYIKYYGGSISNLGRDRSRDKWDIDVIRDNHQFLWDDEDSVDSWEKRLAKKYYDKLFREYCIADLSRYKENKIGLRWRIESEVVSGKGQFQCGCKTCKEEDGLKSWEVNFTYAEHGVKKNALVKLRLCSDCSYKLNYRYKRKDVTKKLNKNSTNTTEHKSPVISQNQGNGDIENTEGEEGERDTVKTDSTDPETNIWAGPAKQTDDEKTLDDEFNEYLEDMFL